MRWFGNRASLRVFELYCAPGIAGIAAYAECLPADIKSIDSLLALAKRVEPDLTVVGPELPLQLGVVVEFARQGYRYWPHAGRRATRVQQKFCQRIHAASSHSHGALCNLR